MSFSSFFELCQSYSRLNFNFLSEVVTVNDITFSVEVYKYSELNLTSQSQVSDIFSGHNSIDGPTQILITNTLSIASGVKLTPTNRCKGFFIFTKKFINNGTLSMTSRGCNAVGQDLCLFVNGDLSKEIVPAVGGKGAPSHWGQGYYGPYSWNNGMRAGYDGILRATGGGGTGCSYAWNGWAYSSRGGNGTSFSGGSGSGAADADNAGSSGSVTSGQGSDTGGPGGNSAFAGGSGWSFIISGGTGNPNGSDRTYNCGITAQYFDNGGTGGLLVLYCNFFENNGFIQSLGGDARAFKRNSNASAAEFGGGASGGGSINIFYTRMINEGVISAKGGKVMTTSYKANGGGIEWPIRGSAGGNGSVTLTKIQYGKFLVKIKDIILFKDLGWEKLFLHTQFRKLKVLLSRG